MSEFVDIVPRIGKHDGKIMVQVRHDGEFYMTLGPFKSMKDARQFVNSAPEQRKTIIDASLKVGTN